MKPHSWTTTAIAVACLLLAGCQPAAVAPSAAPVAAAPATDIDEWFAAYYAYAKADLRAHPDRYLPVIFNAVDAGADARRLLADDQLGRIQAIDHRIGFLVLYGALDDSELTMAVYTPLHGAPRLLVSSSICVDECDQHVEVFTRNEDGRLTLLPDHGMLPAIAPADFLWPGVTMPVQFEGITPVVDYRPQADGRTLMAWAWFGDEVENEVIQQASGSHGGVTRPLALHWDAARGSFVRP